MSEDRSAPSRPLPRWLVCVMAIAVAGHFSAILLLVLSAPSGPWPSPFGSSTSIGPQFASAAGEIGTKHYLAPLKLTHNYHFLRNRTGQPDVFFEVRLKDELGKVTQTLRFPDPKANPWVRHRQGVLAAHLTDDHPVQPSGGEAIPAPNQNARTVTYWHINADGSLSLKSVPEHLVPRDRNIYRPSDWSMILARSYSRHMCRVHGAESAELIRHTRESIFPGVLYSTEPNVDLFQDLASSFGEIKK